MPNYELHHVGIVINDVERAEAFLETFHLKKEKREYVPQYHALCIFMKLESGSSIEVIVPDGGVLRDDNDGKDGIHHEALLVDDINETTAEYEAKGLRMLDPEGVKGAGSI